MKLRHLRRITRPTLLRAVCITAAALLSSLINTALRTAYDVMPPPTWLYAAPAPAHPPVACQGPPDAAGAMACEQIEFAQALQLPQGVIAP